MDAEVRALRRAAAILLALSLARWGLARRAPDPSAQRAGAAVEVLADSARALAADARRRSRPLAPGERLDVNAAPEEELDRLPGVGPATAAAIVRLREERPFRTVEDLQEVRGIGPRLLERLRPLVRVAPSPSGGAERRRAATPRRSPPRSTRPGARVDLNSADSAALVALPGIGPALAARILEARRHRRFSTVDELVRVSGIGPRTVEKLQPYVQVREW